MGHTFKNLVFSVFPKVEGMSNDMILEKLMEAFEEMGGPMIASSDIKRFESNNH